MLKPSWNYHVKSRIDRLLCSCIGCLAYHLPTLFLGGRQGCYDIASARITMASFCIFSVLNT